MCDFTQQEKVMVLKTVADVCFGVRLAAEKVEFNEVQIIDDETLDFAPQSLNQFLAPLLNVDTRFRRFLTSSELKRKQTISALRSIIHILNSYESTTVKFELITNELISRGGNSTVTYSVVCYKRR